MIDGVQIHPLKQIPDDRGRVMHMLRADSPWFQQFGEIYFSAVFHGKVKGWHIHTRMTINYAVPVGKIRLVLYDIRPFSSTHGKVQELILGPEEQYALITVPPGIWNGFQGLMAPESLVANCASIPHDPNEIERIDPYDRSVPYQWPSVS